MTRRYTRPDYRGGGNVSFTVYPNDNKSFTVSDGKITKTVNVRDNREYTYKLNKTCISASGGAHALYKYVDDCLYNKFCECLAWQVLNHALAIGQ